MLSTFTPVNLYSHNFIAAVLLMAEYSLAFKVYLCSNAVSKVTITVWYPCILWRGSLKISNFCLKHARRERTFQCPAFINVCLYVVAFFTTLLTFLFTKVYIETSALLEYLFGVVDFFLKVFVAYKNCGLHHTSDTPTTACSSYHVMKL